MGKLFQGRSTNNMNQKFQDRGNTEEQLEDMEQFLSKIVEKDSTVSKRFPTKIVILICFFVLLGLGGTWFILRDSNKNVNSMDTPNVGPIERYPSLEQSYIDSLDKLLTSGQDIINNLKKENTQCTGDMSIEMKSEFKEIPIPNFHYDINGSLTKDLSAATLDLSIQNKHIATKTFYKKAGEKDLIFFYPEYGSKPANMKPYTSEENIWLYDCLTSLVPFISKYYTPVIQSIVKEGTLSYNRNVPYTVENIPSTCNCYDITLTKEQFCYIGINLISQINENNETTKDYALLRFFIQDYLDNLESDSADTEQAQDEQSTFFSMKVYCDDDKILGREITISYQGSSTRIFLGSLQSGNNYAFSFKVEKQSDDHPADEVISFKVRTHNSNNIYSGSFNVYYNGLILTGSLDNVTIDSSNPLFPYSGMLSVSQDSTGRKSHYPNEFQIAVLQERDKVLIKGYTFYQFIGQYEDGLDDIGYRVPNCTCDFNLTLTKGTTGDFTLPKEASKKISSNWKEYAKALSDQPIEKMIDNYTNASDEVGLCSHSRALELTENGQLYAFIPDIYALLSSYNDEPYYNVADFNLPDFTSIDYFGNYSTVFKEPITEHIQTEDEAYENSARKPIWLEDGKEIAAKPIFKTSIKGVPEKLIKLMKDKTGMEFQLDTKTSGAEVNVQGNIFTGYKEYSLLNEITISQKANPNELGLGGNGSIIIQYDALTGQIKNLRIDDLITKTDPETLNRLACEITSLINPSKTAFEYAQLILDSDNQGVIISDSGCTSVSYYLDQYSHDNINIFNLSIYCEYPIEETFDFPKK